MLRILSGLVLTLASITASGETVLSNEDTSLLINERGAIIERWHVVSESPDGFDALTNAHDAPATRHFSLDLQINGDDHSAWAATAPYELQKDGARAVRLIAATETGLVLTKSFELSDKGYRGRLALRFENTGSSSFAVGDEAKGVGIVLGPGIGRSSFSYEGLAATLYDFTRGIVAADSGIHELVHDAQVEIADAEIEWAGLHSRYRLLAIGAPAQTAFTRVRLDTPVHGEDHLQAGTTLTVYVPAFVLAPGESREFTMPFYGGLKAVSALSAGEPDLSGVLYSGLWNWMRHLSFAIQWVLGVLYWLIPNWGLAIIALALLVRLLLRPVSTAAARQQKQWMAKQSIIKPRVDEIKKNYRGGEQVERIMEVYEQEGVSPYGGLKSLLVVLLQIPVFVAIFNILGQAVEFRYAGFLWMESLALPDALLRLDSPLPFFGRDINVLPVLMAVVSLEAMKLSASGDDGGKANFIALLLVNVGFFFLFYHFPSGMVLYWTVANFLHLLSLLYVRVQFESRVGVG